MKTASKCRQRKNPLLFEIKGNSLDDGPGIRTVIFFKGCPLDCVWCHNPESKSHQPEISYDPKKCIGCGTCIRICPATALSKENPYYINRNICNICGKCVDECPSGALECVGFEMSIYDVKQKVIADKPFFDNSGGGMTLSGGEPTLHMEYAAELARVLKEMDIHVLLETCGLFSYDHFKDMLLPYLDIIYYDLKLFDDAEHKLFCGVSNSVIIQNFTRLVNDTRKRGISLLPRIPLVPGITDTDSNILAISSFLKEWGVMKADLLPYNPLWHDKSWSLGRKDGYSEDKDMTKFLSQEKILHCKAIILAAGIDV